MCHNVLYLHLCTCTVVLQQYACCRRYRRRYGCAWYEIPCMYRIGRGESIPYTLYGYLPIWWGFHTVLRIGQATYIRTRCIRVYLVYEYQIPGTSTWYACTRIVDDAQCAGFLRPLGPGMFLCGCWLYVNILRTYENHLVAPNIITRYPPCVISRWPAP